MHASAREIVFRPPAPPEPNIKEAESTTMDDRREQIDPVVAEVTVNSEHGLHLVPCSKIAEASRPYSCEIQIRNGDHVVDAKAVFDLMGLRAEMGTRLTLQAQGPDAEQIINELVELFENNFYVDRNTA